jgi:hypothetical protein
VKCDHPSVTEGAWPAKALAITEAGRTAMSKHHAELAKKGRHGSDKRVIFRRDHDRYVIFLGNAGRSPREISQRERIGLDIGLQTSSIRRWHTRAMLKPEREPVSFCVAAMSAWFERARYNRRWQSDERMLV